MPSEPEKARGPTAHPESGDFLLASAASGSKSRAGAGWGREEKGCSGLRGSAGHWSTSALPLFHRLMPFPPGSWASRAASSRNHGCAWRECWEVQRRDHCWPLRPDISSLLSLALGPCGPCFRSCLGLYWGERVGTAVSSQGSVLALHSHLSWRAGGALWGGRVPYLPFHFQGSAPHGSAPSCLALVPTLQGSGLGVRNPDSDPVRVR